MCIVNFDAGPSWSGLMPISGAKNETRKLFFWYVCLLCRLCITGVLKGTIRFWPTNNASNVNDLLFWTNGASGAQRPSRLWN